MLGNSVRWRKQLLKDNWGVCVYLDLKKMPPSFIHLFGYILADCPKMLHQEVL